MIMIMFKLDRYIYQVIVSKFKERTRKTKIKETDCPWEEHRSSQ